MSSEPFLSRHEMPCNPILIKIPLCFSGTNQPVQLSPHCTGLIIKQSKAPILFLLHVAGTGHCSAGEQCAVPPAGGKAAEWQEDDFFLHCCFCFSNIYRSRVNLSSHLWVGGSLPWKASSLPPSPDALCSHKIAHSCSTFPKRCLERERQIQSSSQLLCLPLQCPLPFGYAQE